VRQVRVLDALCYGCRLVPVCSRKLPPERWRGLPKHGVDRCVDDYAGRREHDLHVLRGAPPRLVCTDVPADVLHGFKFHSLLCDVRPVLRDSGTCCEALRPLSLPHGCVSHSLVSIECRSSALLAKLKACRWIEGLLVVAV
jgi:hypothetical protein